MTSTSVSATYVATSFGSYESGQSGDDDDTGDSDDERVSKLGDEVGEDERKSALGDEVGNDDTGAGGAFASVGFCEGLLVGSATGDSVGEL